jgi:type VI secretion system protein ImpK
MRMIDCFLELIAFVSLKGKDLPSEQPSFEEVRHNVLRLMSDSEACLSRNGFSTEDSDLAKFAVCAWVDETLLSMQWPGRSQWQKEQLQRLFFKTTRAGEEFFERLNRLGVHQQDVREVYYLCLALGFSGKYIHDEDRFLLDKLRGSNLKLLFGSSVGIPSFKDIELFPEALPDPAESEASKQSTRFSLAPLLGIVAPVVVFGILYGIFAMVLDGYADSILQMVPR